MIRLLLQKLRRRRNNVDFARDLGVRVGDNCNFIATTRTSFGSEPYLIEIGDHVELAAGVRFLPHDGAVWVFREKEPTIDVMEPIKIGSNVFIGYNTVLLPGADIGDNCIIGACSVVSGRIESGSVAAGVPARRLKSIEEYREKVDNKILPTKTMSRDEKREFLHNHFGLR